MAKNMTVELVSQVEIRENGDLLFRLANPGNPSYQYVYRAGSGVYWDQDLNAFKFSTKNDGLYTKWFKHILRIVEAELGLRLRLNQNVTWTNIPDEIREEMLRAVL